MRVNALSTPWGADDVRALGALSASAQPAAYVLPKVEAAEQLRALDGAMRAAGTPLDVRIWGLIETPLGVLSARDIGTGGGGRLDVIVAGTSDLSKDLQLGQSPHRMGLQTSLQLIVLAARAAGVSGSSCTHARNLAPPERRVTGGAPRRAVVDGVFLSVSDAAGFLAECEQGVALGFDGKAVIHPSQVGPANAAFSPSAAGVAHARRVVEAYEVRAPRTMA